MLDANNLYKQGVTAIKNNDTIRGRKLLTRSLKLNSQNDKAWIWLARSYDEPSQRIKCLERALAVNPNNAKTRATLDALRAKNGYANTPNRVPTAHITGLMKKAEQALSKDDTEGAITLWVEVLEVQVDHPEAIKNAVKALIKLKYTEDAEELLWRAIDANTNQPSIYHTAYDLAQRNPTNDRLDALRRKLMLMPDVHDTLFVRMAQGFIDTNQLSHAAKSLERALTFHPEHQQLLLLMGDVQAEMNFSHQAVVYYNRVAKISTSTPEGKEADKKLQAFPPVLTDKERGSISLAWREVTGIIILYVLLIWQDAGLNLTKAEPRHIIGLIISIIGSYLLITATSSPQQPIIARYFGGKQPSTRKQRLITEQNGALQEATRLAIIPQNVRFILGGASIVILMVAFVMVFGTSIDLLFNPIDPPNPIIPGF